MKKTEVKAQAKINLTLDVLEKRADGYHEVEMVMQSIELSDTVVIEEKPERGIEVFSDNPLLPGGEENIAYRAAKLLTDMAGFDKGIRITIKKNIPLAAGLAGGSADAAAVLKGINSLFELGLTGRELAEKAALIGSDVPFCIMGGTSLARGRGEILTRLPDVPEIWVVLAKPPLEVSTAEIYRHFKLHRVSTRPSTTAMIEAIETGSVNSIIANLANVLEQVTLNRYPVVAEVKKAMLEAGAAGVLMSGSGPTVFGICGSRNDAFGVAGRLKALPTGAFVEVSRTCPAERQEF